MLGVKNMKIIGVTGHAGTGKSKILDYINNNYNAICFKLDDMGRKLQQKGEDCYNEIVYEFSRPVGAGYGDGRIWKHSILLENGELNRSKLAKIVFSNEDDLIKLEKIMYNYIIKNLEDEWLKISKSDVSYDFFVIESATLIKSGLEDFCDYIFLITTNEKIRRERLYKRGYSDERIDNMAFLSKLDSFSETTKENVFQINNSSNFIETEGQIKKYLEKLK